MSACPLAIVDGTPADQPRRGYFRTAQTDPGAFGSVSARLDIVVGPNPRAISQEQSQTRDFFLGDREQIQSPWVRLIAGHLRVAVSYRPAC